MIIQLDYEIFTALQTLQTTHTLAGLKVLVVDDSPDILELISIWLRRANAEVRIANSAVEALQQIQHYKADILLSDIGMPEMDGYELIKSVRALPDSAVNQIKAIALTAYAKDEERTMALKAGFQLHISKPIANDRLISAIAQLMQH